MRLHACRSEAVLLQLARTCGNEFYQKTDMTRNRTFAQEKSRSIAESVERRTLKLGLT
jgi:hypothetical protein